MEGWETLAVILGIARFPNAPNDEGACSHWQDRRLGQGEEKKLEEAVRKQRLHTAERREAAAVLHQRRGRAGSTGFGPSFGRYFKQEKGNGPGEQQDRGHYGVLQKGLGL
jgi:hypothetical protein